MRKIMITTVAAATLFAAGTLVGSMRSTSQSDSDLRALFSMSAAAQAGGVYVNAVDLVIVRQRCRSSWKPSRRTRLHPFKEPGCREFNVLVLANRPNHVFLFEVYDNEGALAAHRETPHFKKFFATAGNLVADRNVRGMSVIAMNSKGQG